MQTITIVLLTAAAILLILLATAPCEKDHYADQVVHAGAGNIAGPIVQVDRRQYVPPRIDRYSEPEPEILVKELDMSSSIVGRF